MPKRLFEQAQVTLNGYDVSGDIHAADVLLGRRDGREITGLLDEYTQYEVNQIKRFACRLGYFNNFDGTSQTPTGITTVLRRSLDAVGTSGLLLVIRATTAARSVRNPEWQCQVTIDGDFNPLSGSVGEGDKGSVNLRGISDLQWLTSSS